MSPLPRPVKQVLVPPDEAAVGRAWVRLETTRRVPTTVRPAIAWAAFAALAAAGVALVVRPAAPAPASSAAASAVGGALGLARAPASPPPVGGGEAAALVSEGSAAAAGSVTAPPRAGPRVFWHGRPTAGAARPSLVEGPAPAPEQPVDEAGALLASADDAWRAGQTTRAATLLAELAAHHADDARAGAALYLLGQMQLDVLGQPAEAVASFQRALQLGVPDDVVGPLWTALEQAQRSAEAPAP